MWWCCMASPEALARKLIVMRDLLDEVIDGLVASQSHPEQGCQHPANQREDLQAMGATGEHWRCKACGYEYPEAVDGR